MNSPNSLFSVYMWSSEYLSTSCQTDRHCLYLVQILSINSHLMLFLYRCIDRFRLVNSELLWGTNLKGWEVQNWRKRRSIDSWITSSEYNHGIQIKHKNISSAAEFEAVHFYSRFTPLIVTIPIDSQQRRMIRVALRSFENAPSASIRLYVCRKHTSLEPLIITADGHQILDAHAVDCG